MKGLNEFQNKNSRPLFTIIFESKMVTSRVEILVHLLKECPSFNPRLFNMVELFMVEELVGEEFMVKEFIVEKSWIEKLRFEKNGVDMFCNLFEKPLNGDLCLVISKGF